MTLAPPPPITVDVPFADTSAEALCFSLEHTRITPLASTIIDLPGTDGLRLELHVIGSSHQVILSGHESDAFIETFACLGDGAAETMRPDWGTTQTMTGMWSGFTRHRFTAQTHEVETSFAEAAAEVVERSSAYDNHLVVAFPGDPGALTALALTSGDDGEDGEGDMSWETWHCYPQHRQIVHSRSELRRSA
ncbi:DUF2617 family protein [Brevibacterium sp. ZH18]|uniref:DUF2617 family protein n=1 Tax=Brevibacterium sp. ZH18 TaxID=2927784 RepID=UPI001F618D83|nr:DUF2617 family protein [Brevibacterium sp. ZH18]MCI4010951.1 DUF2617 family protein [Brevibacterium sp. ZH18]